MFLKTIIVSSILQFLTIINIQWKAGYPHTGIMDAGCCISRRNIRHMEFSPYLTIALDILMCDANFREGSLIENKGFPHKNMFHFYFTNTYFTSVQVGTVEGFSWFMSVFI
ncbi:hypothetical protein XENTR_v10018328 [Xenopus tropicalis]|nr:hypothetical protein XENTR_v10018328 [Xenopus tropicalis]